MGYCEDINKRYSIFKRIDNMFERYNIIILDYLHENSKFLGVKLNEIHFDHNPGGVIYEFEAKSLFIETDDLVKIFEFYNKPLIFHNDYDSTVRLKQKLLNDAYSYTNLYKKAAMIRVKELRPEFKKELVYDLEIIFNKYDICVIFALDSYDEEYCIVAEDLDKIAEDNKPITVEDILV